MRRTPPTWQERRAIDDRTCEQFADGRLDRDLAEWIGDDLAELVVDASTFDDDGLSDVVSAYGEAILEGDADLGPEGFGRFLAGTDGPLWAIVSEVIHSRKADAHVDAFLDDRIAPGSWACWEPEHAVA